MDHMATIHFLDVTNRDGVQTARTGLSKFGKTMVNFYLGRLGVAQSEIGFPFLFHEAPYMRAQVALAKAGAFGDLLLSGWCRGVSADVEQALPLGLEHYNLSISTSDQMLAKKFRGGSTVTPASGRWPTPFARPRPAAPPPSASTPRTDPGPTTGSCWSSRWPPGTPALTGSATATRSAATPPGAPATRSRRS